MTQLYKDDLRKQLVFLDNLDEKTVEYWNTQFQKNVKKEENSLGDYMSYYMFNERKRDSVSYILDLSANYTPFFKDIIQMSLYYFEKAGLNANYKKYKAQLSMCRYDANPDSTEEFMIEKGWNRKYSLNDVNRYENDTFSWHLGHVCIFCIQKDEDIKGGDISFFPNFIDQTSTTNELYYLLTGGCSMDYSELSIPMKRCSVIVLSGDTWHILQEMKMKKGNEVRLIISKFHYAIEEY